MSRSYKKYPVVRQENADKRMTNRCVRRVGLDEDIPSGGIYKKYNKGDSDYSYRWTEEEAIANYYGKRSRYLQRKYPTLEDYLIWYRKNTLGK